MSVVSLIYLRSGVCGVCLFVLLLSLACISRITRVDKTVAHLLYLVHYAVNAALRDARSDIGTVPCFLHLK